MAEKRLKRDEKGRFWVVFLCFCDAFFGANMLMLKELSGTCTKFAAAFLKNVL